MKLNETLSLVALSLDTLFTVILIAITHRNTHLNML